MFGMMMAQLGINGKDIWSTYSPLKYREVLIIDYTSNGIKIKIKKKD
jgi:hypothetical protein